MASKMGSTGAREVVDEFGAAFARKDFAKARRLLHDDLSFHGPIDTFSKADDYIASVAQLASIMKGMRHQKTLAQENDVAVFYVLDTVVAEAPIADWYTVKDGKIASIRTYFDARPFAPQHEKP